MMDPRLQFVAFSDQGTELNNKVREKLSEVIADIESMPPSAERTLSVRKLEEAAMWLGKAIRVTPGYYR